MIRWTPIVVILTVASAASYWAGVWAGDFHLCSYAVVIWSFVAAVGLGTSGPVWAGWRGVLMASALSGCLAFLTDLAHTLSCVGGLKHGSVRSTMGSISVEDPIPAGIIMRHIRDAAGASCIGAIFGILVSGLREILAGADSNLEAQMQAAPAWMEPAVSILTASAIGLALIWVTAAAVSERR